MKVALILFIVFFLFPAPAFSSGFAQNSILPDAGIADSAMATLTLSSNPQGAKVYIDSLFVGRTPLDSQRIAPGKHVLRCVHPNSPSWAAPMITETLAVSASGHLGRTLTFPTLYVVKSYPYGAIVRYRDSILGTTPYMLSANSGKDFVTLSKEGYEDVILPLTPPGGEIFAQLRSLLKNPAGESSFIVSGEQSKNLFPVYLASGTTVLAGVAAAYFKIKADGRYNDYRLSGDTGTLDEVHRLDRFSGIALVTSELSLIALSYLLLSR